MTSPQAFSGLRRRGLPVRQPARTLAVAGHNIPTTGQALGLSAIADAAARMQLETLERSVVDR